jgi:hypothetical protein
MALTLDGEAVLLTFIPKGFETLAGGKRSVTIPPGCVGVAGRFPVVALRLPPANI